MTSPPELNNQYNEVDDRIHRTRKVYESYAKNKKMITVLAKFFGLGESEIHMVPMKVLQLIKNGSEGTQVPYQFGKSVSEYNISTTDNTALDDYTIKIAPCLSDVIEKLPIAESGKELEQEDDKDLVTWTREFLNTSGNLDQDDVSFILNFCFFNNN